MSEPILRVRGLTTTFGDGALHAVRDVSFDVMPGEVLGLVGESGSGKSVTLRSLLRLLPAGGRVAGSVCWHGRDVLAMNEAELRGVRGGEISMIFQEPMTALNPVLPIRVQIEENLRAHTKLDGRGRRARARELMDLVGIPDAARRLDEFPHQFSGGMRQRAMIAIALASDPKLLLADEPTTALDVTIQDQILKLILELRDELAMSVVFVTHDLGVVSATCDRMAVMYAGRIVEEGAVADVFACPRHAYTHGLLGSVPQAGAERSMLLSIEGTPPGLARIPEGCAFNPRCDFATDICRRTRPRLAEMSPGHHAACHNAGAVAAAGSPVRRAMRDG
ncbi:ABC transporter ATP-binding protein [uncultured Jannaschia sp.]|uniref:ABC transporter ATP-binding protein n=1 Tax=uncultured Jannaschia sp. TaxID=293347 RepID=UPI002610204B|nr:ABC transporter ATP-binding protein [uncultured Jannaschia sp.]